MPYFKESGIKCFSQNKQFSLNKLILVSCKSGHNFQRKFKERTISRKSFLSPVLLSLMQLSESKEEMSTTQNNKEKDKTTKKGGLANLLLFINYKY